MKRAECYESWRAPRAPLISERGQGVLTRVWGCAAHIVTRKFDNLRAFR